MKGIKIVATGRCAPRRRVTNDDMSKIVDTSDEWIYSRSGIKNRYFCGEGETGISLAETAAKLAMERAGISPSDLCACVVATTTPDHTTPANACLLQAQLQLPEDIPCFDLSAGCTGFMYGLQVVRGLLLQDARPYALLVGSEVLSKVLDFEDRTTCVLFGDGAAAAVVTLEEGRQYACTLGTRGDDQAIFAVGPGVEPVYLRMDGKRVFRFAVEAVPSCINTLLQQTGLAASDIDWFVPHQANRRIIESAAKRVGVDMDRFYLNLDEYGNTSAASIPIALDEMAEKGLLQRGQKIICVGFGAGLTWGGALINY